MVACIWQKKQTNENLEVHDDYNVWSNLVAWILLLHFHVCAIPTTVMSSSPSNFLKRVFSFACFSQQWQVIHCTLTSTFFPLFKSDYLHVNNETNSLPKIRTSFRFQGQTSSGVNQSNIDTQNVINNAANVSGDSPGR